MINITREALEQLVLKLESLEKKMFDCDKTPNCYARMCGSIAAELGAVAAISEQCPSGWQLIPIDVSPEMEAVYRNDKGAYETAAELHAALLKAVGGRSNGGI